VKGKVDADNRKLYAGGVKLLLVALAASCLLAQTDAARDAAAERLVLARQAVTAMELAKTMESSMAASQEAVGANFVDSMLRTNPAFNNLTPAQRTRVTNALTAMNQRLQARMQEELKKSMNVGEEVVNLLAPVYASYFDAAELRKLIEFYETPVGRKLANASTATQAEVMQRMQSGLLPRMMTILERVVRDEQSRMTAEVARLAEEIK
jgi:hypothetical protein